MGRLTLFCVITIVFIGLTSGADVLPMDSINAAVGESINITTSLPEAQTPLFSVIWQFGEKNIVNSVGAGVAFAPAYKDRAALSTLTGSLELRNLALSDTGLYSVTIRPTSVEERTGNTTLNVYERVSNVRVTATGTDLVEFNSSVSLSCSASGSSLSFLWFNGSAEVTASDRVQFNDGGATLTIDPVLRYDNRSYSCEVSNPVSSSTSDLIPLSVSYGPDVPIVTITPPVENHKEGTDVSLSCSADSRPDAQYEWLSNGVLSSTGAHKPLDKIQINQSGNYSCQAFNSKTLRYKTSQPALISVWKKLRNITFELSSVQPIEGLSVNLTCDASGSILTREWTIKGIEIKPSENIVFYDQKRVLSFRALNRTDAGKYTCNISSPIDSLSAEYEVKVNYGPDNVQVPEEVTVKKKHTLKLSCSAESVPTANYTWVKDGTILVQSQEFTKENIQKSDSGNYTCRAKNDITNKSSDASCLVKVKEPDPPPPPPPPHIIVIIVLSCIAVILLVSGGVFYAHKKKKLRAKSNTRTDGEGQDNSAFAQNQEPNYADVRFVKKDGEVVQLGVQNNNTEYSEGQRNNNPPASHLPSYSAHMKRGRRAAPEPPTEYAEVCRK